MVAKFDAMFGMGQRDENVVHLNINDIRPFSNHPFKVLDNPDMDALVASIRADGVREPVVVRPHPDGRGYEMLSGHRRRAASIKVGKETVPAIVRDTSDDEAEMIMLNGNLHRSNLLPSEKAYSYKMRRDQKKKKAGRPKAGEMAEGVRWDEELAAEVGESRASVQRHIRLTFLCLVLIEAVDTKVIKLGPAEQLSYLDDTGQKLVVVYLETGEKAPNLAQSKEIRRLADEGQLTAATLEAVFLSQNEPKKQIAIDPQRLEPYFPDGYSYEQKEELLVSLLEQWAEQGIQE